MLKALEPILLEFTSNIISVFLWLIIVYIFLDFKSKYKRNIALYLVGYILIFILKNCYPQYFVLKFIWSIYLVFFIYILYKGNLIHKLFVLWISNCFNYAIEMFIISFTNLGFNNNLFFSSQQEGANGIWVTLTKTILFILVFIMLKLFASDKTLKIDILTVSQTFILTILPIFSYATIFILNKGVKENLKVPINVSAFLLIVSTGTIIYNVVVLILIDRLILNKKYKYLSDISQAELLTQFNHYKNIMEKTEQTRKLKHDMKNHIMCIRTLIEKNEIDKAKELMNDLENKMSTLNLEISSGNSIADAILNEKCKSAKRQGIKFEFSGALPQENFINPFDISTIFSNALDNAIEAAKNADEADKFVKTEVHIHENCILITIANSANNVKIYNNELYSSKEDKEKHGFGLKNMKESVGKYGGELSIKCENNIFILEILFFLKRDNNQ